MQFDPARIYPFIIGVYFGFCLLDIAYGGIWELMRKHQNKYKPFSGTAAVVIPLVVLIWVLAWPLRLIYTSLCGFVCIYKMLKGRL